MTGFDAVQNGTTDLLHDEAIEYAWHVVHEIDALLTQPLHAAYVIGSLAFGDYAAGVSDIDLALVSRRPVGEDEREQVAEALEPLLPDCPARGLGLVIYRGPHVPADGVIPFDKDMAGQLVGLDAGERVRAVSPLGYPVDQSPLGERVVRTFLKAAKRRPLEEVAPGMTSERWPAWAVGAAEAVRAAPSGGNRQPWTLRWEPGGLVLSMGGEPRWTAPMDLGIAMLHMELAALHEGAKVRWELLDEPDVARLAPERRRAKPRG